MAKRLTAEEREEFLETLIVGDRVRYVPAVGAPSVVTVEHIYLWPNKRLASIRLSNQKLVTHEGRHKESGREGCYSRIEPMA